MMAHTKETFSIQYLKENLVQNAFNTTLKGLYKGDNLAMLTLFNKPYTSSCSISHEEYKHFCVILICDWACKNKVYLHTKFGLIFELQLTISYEVQKL